MHSLSYLQTDVPSDGCDDSDTQGSPQTPHSYFLLSVFSCLFLCWIPSLVAISYSLKVSPMYKLARAVSLACMLL